MILEDATGRVLFIIRACDPAAGKLDLPGGFVDPGETAEEAVRREVMEELGLRLDDIAYIGCSVNNYPYKGIVYPTSDIVFHSRMPDAKPVLDPHEAAGIVILRPDEIDSSRLAFKAVARALSLKRHIT